eukprot:CAMPEP_0179004668 /NCGR_PEP_ID=MMETSP0795-20121207/13444_1 /TAXON_ID=88552 /ORGANISM="Amoebophrya sp., Strain Ameob2" /LENGTH=847 /DNA_ID=CAMNT_0020698979 /DNA_START=238 /DNA_END=2779 /DNA_ORIENTATION=-
MSSYTTFDHAGNPILVPVRAARSSSSTDDHAHRASRLRHGDDDVGAAGGPRPDTSRSSEFYSSSSSSKLASQQVYDSLMCEFLSNHSTAPHTSNTTIGKAPTTNCLESGLQSVFGSWMPSSRVQLLYFATQSSVMMLFFATTLTLLALGEGVESGPWPLSLISNGGGGPKVLTTQPGARASDNEAGPDLRLPWYNRSVESAVAEAPLMLRLMSLKAALGLFLCAWYRHPLFVVRRESAAKNSGGLFYSNINSWSESNATLRSVLKGKSSSGSCWLLCPERSTCWLDFEARTGKPLLYTSGWCISNTLILVLALSGSVALVDAVGLGAANVFLALYAVAIGLSATLFAADVCRLVFFQIDRLGHNNCPMLSEATTPVTDVQVADRQSKRNVAESLLDRRVFVKCGLEDELVTARTRGARPSTARSRAPRTEQATQPRSDQTGAGARTLTSCASEFVAGPSVWESTGPRGAGTTVSMKKGEKVIKGIGMSLEDFLTDEDDSQDKDPLLASWESDRFWRSEEVDVETLPAKIAKAIIDRPRKTSGRAPEHYLIDDQEQDDDVLDYNEAPAKEEHQGLLDVDAAAAGKIKLYYERVPKGAEEARADLHSLSDLSKDTGSGGAGNFLVQGSTTASGEEDQTLQELMASRAGLSSASSSTTASSSASTRAGVADEKIASLAQRGAGGQDENKANKQSADGSHAAGSATATSTASAYAGDAATYQVFHMADGTTSSENAGSKEAPATEWLGSSKEAALPLEVVVAKGSATEAEAEGKEDQDMFRTPKRRTRGRGSESVSRALAAANGATIATLSSMTYRQELRLSFILSYVIAMLGLASAIWTTALNPNAMSEW